MSQRLAEEASFRRDNGSLGVSKRLLVSISQRLKKKTHRCEPEEDDCTVGVSLNCLTWYCRGGASKVSADSSDELGNVGGLRQSNASKEGKGFTKVHGTEETTMKCFSYGLKEKFGKKNNSKVLELKESQQNSDMHVYLPDDIVEMFLMRLPVASLMTARLVCKKWRNLTTTSQFMQMRRESLYQTPWLFLFGVVKDGYYSGEIHSFDVCLRQWHKIDAEALKGRFQFSVASILDDVYIVGGCSSLTNFGKMDGSSFKTHNDVLVFNALTKSWNKIASMKYARSAPILGTYKISLNCRIMNNQQNGQGRRFFKSRIDGASDVYEHPCRLSVRRQFRISLDDNEVSSSNMKPYSTGRQKGDQLHARDCRRFVLFAVGGLGNWNESLYSGEIYDSLSNKWMEIQMLPLDFGVVCSGVVYNGIFYVYSEDDNLASYDIERGFWVRIQTTPPPPRVREYYPKLVSCNRRLFMLSVSWCEREGEIGRRNKAVRKLWELDLMHLTWTEISVHPDAPMDWNAAFVADRNLIFGVEMFKIFGQVLDFFTVYDTSDAKIDWNHIPMNHGAQDLDAASCMTKSMAVLHL